MGIIGSPDPRELECEFLAQLANRYGGTWAIDRTTEPGSVPAGEHVDDLPAVHGEDDDGVEVAG